MRAFCPTLVSSLVLVGILDPATSVDADQAGWVRFRGPNGSGIAKAPGVPVQWTDQEYRWRVKLPGTGSSSPVVRGNRVFTTCTNEADGSRTLCCFSTGDGRLIWNKTLWAKTHGKNKFNSYASPTPALDEENVFATVGTPGEYLIIAMAQADGSERWRRDLGPFQAQHGFGTSPILFDDLVIAASEQEGETARSRVVAMDRRSGEIRWDSPRRTKLASYSTPCIFRATGEPAQIILTSTAHGISSIDAATGKPLWELNVFTPRLVGSPVVCGNLIMAAAGTGGGGKKMFAVVAGTADKKTEAKVAYEITGTLPYVPTPVSDGRVTFWVTDGGVACCMKVANGDLVWKERVGTKFFASPIWVDDRIYCLGRDGEMVVFAASDKFKLLAKFPLGEASDATPAVADGVMYLRTLSHLMAVGKPES